MADVEMTDAGAASKPTKSTKAGASGEVDSKKPKFEVKKVCLPSHIHTHPHTLHRTC